MKRGSDDFFPFVPSTVRSLGALIHDLPSGAMVRRQTNLILNDNESFRTACAAFQKLFVVTK